MKRLKLVLLLIPLLFYHSLVAQVTLQVFSKSNSIVVDAQALKKIQLSAEKATVEIMTWNQPKIKIDYVIKAKHPTKEIAKQDLVKMKLIQSKLGNVFYVRNYIEIEKNESKPVSNFEVTYKVYIPVAMEMVLSNSFGEVLIPSLSGVFSAELKFCTTQIENINAACEIVSHYGKLSLKNVFSKTEIVSNYTVVSIENIQNQLKLEANFGSIELQNLAVKHPISVKGNKTKMVVQNNLVAAKSTRIVGVGATMNLPVDFLKVKESIGKANWELRNTATKSIEISCNYGTLNYTIR